MRVAVIGAGIIGVTTAYELSRDGHEVTVIERHGSVAAEASFAHAGIVAPGWMSPLAAPASLRLRPTLDAAQWRWLWRWWRAGRGSMSQRLGALLPLARYSHEALQELSTRLGLDFERSPGLLLLMRSEQDLAGMRSRFALLRELGVDARELDAAGCRTVEPALSRDVALAGGLYLPKAEAGNGRLFAHMLRDAAEQAGVEFRFATVVHSIDDATGGGAPLQLQLEQLALTTGFAPSRLATPGTPGARPAPLARRARAAARYLDPVSHEAFDAVVVAAGAGSRALLAHSGIKLPLLAVHGYSVTAPMRAPERAPRTPVIDVQQQVSISRLGQRVRIAGGAELGGSPIRQRQAAIERLYRQLNEWFPGCAHLARPQLWKGARATLPDGPPVIGPAPRRGLWLNLGHGSDGWALACGSARLLADQIGARTPAIDASPFDPQRYARP